MKIPVQIEVDGEKCGKRCVFLNGGNCHLFKNYLSPVNAQVCLVEYQQTENMEFMRCLPCLRIGGENG